MNTGQGVEDPGSFEAAVLKRCPLYKELEPIMGERPNARPLGTNEEDSESEELQAADLFLEEDTNIEPQPESEPGNDSDIDPSLTTPARATFVPNISSGSGATTSTSLSSHDSSKRLSSKSSVASRKAKQVKTEAEAYLSSYFGVDNNSMQLLREREVTAREREADARMIEAQALSEKTKKETAILSIDERVKVARERKRLIEDGICTAEEIDDILPFPK